MHRKATVLIEVVLSADPPDRIQVHSSGKIKVSGRQFTRFQRQSDNCDLEPLLKVPLLEHLTRFLQLVHKIQQEFIFFKTLIEQ